MTTHASSYHLQAGSKNTNNHRSPNTSTSTTTTAAARPSHHHNSTRSRTSSVSSSSPLLFPTTKEQHSSSPGSPSPTHHHKQQQEDELITYDSHFHSSRALREGTAKWYDFLKPLEQPVRDPTPFFEGYYYSGRKSLFRRAKGGGGA